MEGTEGDWMLQENLTRQQNDEIMTAIKESQPIIGDLQSPEILHEEYATNTAFLGKIGELCSKYASIRKSRGDGRFDAASLCLFVAL
jgi:hypothetical protein